MNSNSLHHTILKTGDGSKTLLHGETQETFHDREGALAHARKVFLEPSRIQERFDPGKPVKILEVGFGTGLNFFLASAMAEKAGAPLTYAALEKDLLSDEVVATLDYAKLARCGVVDAYLEWRREWKSAHVSLFKWGLVTLRMLFGNARQTLLGNNSYDIVLMDAFSPEKNPELWETIFLGKLYDSLKPGGCLTTACSDEDIQKRLKVVGFKLTLLEYEGGKTASLRAEKPE